MDNNKLSKQEIATSFSTGKFEITFPYLSNNVLWNIVGETEIKGKEAVVSNCKKTSEYFNSVQTNFIIEDVIVETRKVVVRGTGEFITDDISVNFIKACDVYEFNNNDLLDSITSYCIPDKK